jgi:TonB-linked SusC/RagA family outer membrane protein
MEKGTTNGTTTDMDGHYTISVSGQNPVLVFSYIGYISEEIAAGTNKVVDVILNEDTQKLEEIIVIGYGTARKSDLTGAVTRANMSALEKSPNVDVLSGLKGVVPGLNIGVSTKAGDAPDISIRGQNTISGSTAPLIVLDGTIFRGSLVDINPGDIESIDVLKDASSTAIYGSQAANGVLMITTKMTKNRTKPIVEYSGSFSFQSLINRDFRRLGKDDFLRQLADIYLSASRTGEDMLRHNPDFDVSTYLRDERAISGYLNGVNTDWWELLSEPLPYIQKHNLSLRGRNEMNSYFLSFGFLDQKNMVKNDRYKRYNLRSNFDSEITAWLNIGTQSFFTISDFSGNNTSFGNLFSIPAIVSPCNPEGEYETIAYLGGTNPLLSIGNPDEDIRYNLSGNVYADITIPWIEGMNYRANYSNNWTIYKRYYFDPYANSLTGSAQKRNTNQNEWTFDNVLTWKRSFGKHGVHATLVYGVEKRTYENTVSTAGNFTDHTLGFNNMGAGQSDLNTITSSAWQETSLYNMFRIVYSLNDRYILTATVRRDGFSGFGKNSKFGTFPSLAAAWRISEEGFMKDIRRIDNLKLRISHGISGNRTAGRYATMAQMTGNNYIGDRTGGYLYGDGGSPEMTQAVSTMANANLKWETTQSVNAGIDLGLLNGRLSATYDFYVSNTSNLLYDINIPNINGMFSSSIPTNIGKLQNQGHELSITGVPLKSKTFEWNLTFNFSTNKNTVQTILGLDTDGDGREDDLISSGIFIGRPLGSIYDYHITGMWQLDDYNRGAIPEGFTYGTYRIEDIDGDGNYTAEKDRKITGYTDPLYRFSIRNSVRYRDFELNMFINSIQGGSDHYLGQPLRDLPIPDHLTNNSYVKFDYWTPENPGARYRQLGYYTPALGSGFSPYISRSFVRLQELSLAYNVPANILKKLDIHRLRLYASASNLFTLTGWDGWDPEAGQGVGYVLRINNSTTNTGYPTMKSFTLGMNFEF